MCTKPSGVRCSAFGVYSRKYGAMATYLAWWAIHWSLKTTKCANATWKILLPRIVQIKVSLCFADSLWLLYCERRFFSFYRHAIRSNNSLLTSPSEIVAVAHRIKCTTDSRSVTSMVRTMLRSSGTSCESTYYGGMEDSSLLWLLSEKRWNMKHRRHQR